MTLRERIAWYGVLCVLAKSAAFGFFGAIAYRHGGDYFLGFCGVLALVCWYDLNYMHSVLVSRYLASNEKEDDSIL